MKYNLTCPGCGVKHSRIITEEKMKHAREILGAVADACNRCLAKVEP